MGDIVSYINVIDGPDKFDLLTTLGISDLNRPSLRLLLEDGKELFVFVNQVRKTEGSGDKFDVGGYSLEEGELSFSYQTDLKRGYIK